MTAISVYGSAYVVALITYGQLIYGERTARVLARVYLIFVRVQQGDAIERPRPIESTYLAHNHIAGHVYGVFFYGCDRQRVDLIQIRWHYN